MTAVFLQLKGLQATANPEQQQQLAQAQEVVKRSLEDVRRLTKELRPETLDHLGLASALEHLANDFAERTHLRVERKLKRDLPPLDPGVELVVYRVAQESLTNVIRHAEATAVLLSLEGDTAASCCAWSMTARDSPWTTWRGAGCAGFANAR